MFVTDIDTGKHESTKYVTDKYHQFKFKKNEHATRELESMERNGSSTDKRSRHHTVFYRKTGEAGSRWKENSKELHRFTGMQPLAGSQNGNGRSS